MDRGTDARNLLLGKVIPLRLGYIGVVNRSQEVIHLKLYKRCFILFCMSDDGDKLSDSLLEINILLFKSLSLSCALLFFQTSIIMSGYLFQCCLTFSYPYYVKQLLMEKCFSSLFIFFSSNTARSVFQGCCFVENYVCLFFFYIVYVLNPPLLSLFFCFLFSHYVHVYVMWRTLLYLMCRISL